MATLTRDKIGKLLKNHAIGNIQSLSKKNQFQDKKIDKGEKNESPINVNQNKKEVVLKKINENNKIFISPDKKEDKLALQKDDGKLKNSKESLTVSATVSNNSSIELCNRKKIFRDESLEDKNDPILKKNKYSPEEEARTLGGKQFELVRYLIKLCNENCELKTPPIFTSELIEYLKVKPEHLRNLIFRLQEKKIFEIVFHKSSRNAVRVFSFNKEVYSCFIKREGALSPLKEGITKENSIHELNGEIEEIDLTPVENISFTKAHLSQIYSEYKRNPEIRLPKEIIQDSINYFSFDLKHNGIQNNFKYSPSIVLLSLLKKGKPYNCVTPEKFVSPREEALNAYLERARNKIKIQEEVEAKTKDASFQEWFELLDEEYLKDFNPSEFEIDKNIPKKMRETLMKRATIKNARDFFEINIWPLKIKEIMKNNISMES